MKEQLKQIFAENADCLSATATSYVMTSDKFIEVVSELLNGKIQRITAGQFLAEKGIHSLDTKKRYDEVIKWMEEYANTIQPTPTWVEIKSEDDLPKEEGYYWVINSFDDIFIEDFSPKDIIDRDIWLDHRTHYQPIHKPQPPNKLH